MAEPTPTTVHFSPAFKDADADLILASSDGVHFRVHKLILGKASPIFLDMFALHSPPDDAAGPQTVQLTESSWAVEAILRMCYPMKRSKPSSLNEATTLLAVGRKYSMDAVIDGATSAVVSGRFLVEDTLGLFAFGVHIGDAELAKRGAMECLHTPLASLVDARVEGLEMVSGSAFQRLLRYHRECTKAAVRAVQGFGQWPVRVSASVDHLWCSQCQDDIFIPAYSNKKRLKWYDLDNKWWTGFEKEFVRMLRTPEASPLNIRAALSAAHLRPPPCTTNCRKCSDLGLSELMTFIGCIEERIKEYVLEVPF